MTADRDRRLLLAILGVLGLAALYGYVFLAARLGVAFAIPVGIVGVGGLALALKGALGRALARRLEGTDAGGDALPEQFAAELDELRGRLQELEERVDFSERLLTRQSRETAEP